MDILSKRGLLGLPGMGKLEFCELCVYGKQKKVSFSTATHRTKGILDYVHSDLWDLLGSPLILEMLLYVDY